MPRFPTPEELRSLLLNPPLFQGQVTKGARENGKATIRHPVKNSTIRATVVGGDLQSGNAAVFSLPGGGYVATGRARVSQGVRRDGGVILRGKPSEATPIPELIQDEAYVVHFFVTCGYTSFRDSGDEVLQFGGEQWQYHLYLSDGANTLKLMDTDPFRPFAAGFPVLIEAGSNSVEGILQGTEVYQFNPIDQTNPVIGRSRLTLISPTLFLFQVWTWDYSNYDGSLASRKVSVNSFIVQDWPIVASDFQSGLEASSALSYPAAFAAYLDYLATTPSGIEPSNSPSASQAAANYPLVPNVTRNYINTTGVPSWVEWTDNGLPGESDIFLEIDEGETEPEPVGPLSTNGAAGAQLHLFARNWNVNQNNEANALDNHPVIPFGQMSTEFKAFDDNTTVFLVDEAEPPEDNPTFEELVEWMDGATNTIADIKGGAVPFTNMPRVLYHKDSEGLNAGNLGDRSWLYWGYSVGMVL